MRVRLLLVRVSAMHHHRDLVERPLEKVPVGLEFERLGHDPGSIRQHPVLGDDGIPVYLAGERKRHHRRSTDFFR